MSEKKVALITGASSGIGKAIAITLAKEGYCVIVNYASSKERALEVKKEIESFDGTCEILHGDVSDFERTIEMMDTAFDLFGRIDVLVNNAGITKDQLLLRMSEQEFDDVIAVNLKGTFNCIKGAARKMLKQRKGKIINIASIVGLTGNIGQCNYAASKAGMIGMTKTLAKEFASRNIQVNVIAPGFIETKMTDQIPEKNREEMINSIPAKRLGLPQDIAYAVSFLASEKADYITGQVLTVDGGMTL